MLEHEAMFRRMLSVTTLRYHANTFVHVFLKRTPVKIVVLDEKPLNTGDLSWESISRQAEFKAYDWTRPDEVAARARR